MTAPTPTIEFYQGLPEELSGVRFRRDRATGSRVAVLIFQSLQAIERFNSYTRQFNKSIRLTDAEGEITIEPSSVHIIFGGDEGDDLQRVECKFEIDRDDHWQRFMRFMDRYAEAHNMEYREPDAPSNP